MQYNVTAFVNVDRDNFFGYQSTHPIAEVATFAVKAETAEHAASEMFAIGNRMWCALDGQAWPSDVRSISVGDLLKVRAADGTVAFLTCDRYGWTEVHEPINPVRPLAGTGATSRT